MKKVLLVLGNELSAYQMLAYIKQNRNRYIYDGLISGEHGLVKKKIFSHLKPYLKNYIIINDIDNPIFFSLIKIFNIFKRNQNKINYQKIMNLTKKNFLNINQYNETWFSNEKISSYILYDNKCKKIFFSHSPMDSALLIKQNFFLKFKKKIESYINNKLMFVYFKHDNFFYRSIFSNFFLKKNKQYIISAKIFAKLFKKIEEKKKNSFTNCNLFNFSTPNKKQMMSIDKLFFKQYLNFFFTNILKEFFKKTHKQDINLIKFKNNIPLSLQDKIMKLISKNFPERKTIWMNSIFSELDTLEKIIINFNIKIFFSSFSSSIFFGKIFNRKMLIYDYTKIILKFWKQNWNFVKSKNNYNNYKKSVKFYKNLSKKF